MKKRLIGLLLALTMLVCLAVPAFAAQSGGADIVIKNDNATVTFTDEDGEKMVVTYTDEDVITEGGFYMVLVVRGTEDAYTIDKNSILFIDQVVGDDSGTITFEVFPSCIEDSVILISGVGLSGERGPLLAAIIDSKYILGDVNGDGYVDTFDAIMILQSAAALRTLSAEEKQAANVSGDNYVDTFDAIKILQLVAGLIDSF